MQIAKLRNSIHDSRFPPNGRRAGTIHGLNGFTLIELVIVLIIISVVSALTGVLIYRGSGNSELKTFTRQVSTTLRTARNFAISKKQVYSFIVPEDRTGYGLYAGIGPNEDIEDVPPVVHKAVPESLKIYIDGVEDQFRIDFYPQGNSSGGRLVISNEKGNSFVITINRITGRSGVGKLK
ncbi:MAG TPA: prepilin-type N-terminal cleavage/methylation domain-containing protein [Nitrospirae bacterium]|nr:hypothetical protein BMS3Abin10_01709 [bacterium BMS3Abin10]GBE39144.1 hypothetical protein BMS3Bbin08_01764 [bacterium BMS3Bbin08]HDH00610.1 prepilin-type N-terminal cleavage/methylation domain-containing protein [Nitrospirota bacterium]HDH51633.1 prepilin-type N-terminal cleavage/methylation domain-containing protein [Nitrospirota bacterium]HDK82168.1 prepilin-type N-terminal cleavage/methylation domain-containing protein [Nitrospirota bacterium]